jgi:hypothetical protein
MSALTVREAAYDHSYRAIFAAQAHQLRRGGAGFRIDRAEIPAAARARAQILFAREDGRRAGDVYLWQTRAAAEALYNGEWRARVKQLYGSEPEISWFDTPVIVDNQAGGAITQAA